MPAKTAEQARDEILDCIKGIARYWANLPDQTPTQRCEGLAFSILVMIDGGSMSLPAMDLVLRPHPDDKQFHIDNEEDYFEDGMVVNDCQLHDLFCNKG